MNFKSYADKVKDSLHWWLAKSRPFILNDEYKLELLHIDHENNSAKIKITSLKGIQSTEIIVGVCNE